MRKKLILLSIVTMLTVPMVIEMTGMKKVEAAEIQQMYELSETDDGIEPYADVIVTKFRVNKGKVEYRRWNETKGYWVDSDWIPAD